MLLKIENIQQGYRIIDNIFKCMPIYWNGEADESIQAMYSELKVEIDLHIRYLDLLKKQLLLDTRGGDNIKKLPSIF